MAQKTIRLDKGKEVFAFRYSEGEEAQVLDALIDAVNNPTINLDWFDAAHLSHQIGQDLAQQLSFFAKKKK